MTFLNVAKKPIREGEATNSAETSDSGGRADSAGRADKARPNFEGAIERLAAIVDELERGDLPLESSVALFEEGVLLARRAQGVLDQAEKRVEQLLGFDGQGKPIVEALDP